MAKMSWVRGTGPFSPPFLQFLWTSPAGFHSPLPSWQHLRGSGVPVDSTTSNFESSLNLGKWCDCCVFHWLSPCPHHLKGSGSTTNFFFLFFPTLIRFVTLSTGGCLTRSIIATVFWYRIYHCSILLLVFFINFSPNLTELVLQRLRLI